MFLKFTRNDFLIILSLSLPKFVVGFITSMVIPIFPSLIRIHFNNSMDLINFNKTSVKNGSDYNYYQLSILFVAKNLCQIICSPIVGFYVDLLGSLIVLLIGSILQTLTILVYGLGNLYWLLILGRILEAVGSTSINCAAAAFVAYRFKDHKQRGFVYGVNGLSLCIGSALGPAYGGAIYQYYGKIPSFLSILSLIIFEFIFISLVTFLEKTKEKKSKEKLYVEIEIEPKKDYISSMENVIPIPLTEVLPTSIKAETDEHNDLINGTGHDIKPSISLISQDNKNKLDHEKVEKSAHNAFMFFKDPFFIISIGIFPVIFVSIFLLFSSLPRYMVITFNSSESQQGVIWIVNIFGYTLGFIIGNIVNSRISAFRHIVLAIYICVHGLALVCIAAMPVWWSISIPLCMIVHVHLVVEVVMAPILATIVETRHSSKFGIMSGIIMMTIAITASLGSFLGPILLSTIGFKYTYIGVCLINLTYAPLCLFLRRFCRAK